MITRSPTTSGSCTGGHSPDGSITYAGLAVAKISTFWKSAVLFQDNVQPRQKPRRMTWIKSPRLFSSQAILACLSRNGLASAELQIRPVVRPLRGLPCQPAGLPAELDTYTILEQTLCSVVNPRHL